MTPLPKNKLTRHRRGNRRRHQHLITPTLVPCPNCREMMRAHHACRSCGQYRGRQVLPQAGEQQA